MRHADNFFTASGEPRTPTTLFAGVEVELEFRDASGHDVDSFESEYPAGPWGMRPDRPRRSCLEYKGDGSLQNGCEFALPPSTFAWYREHREAFALWLDTLRADCSTHDECGIHVHLSLAHFSAGHLLRFMDLVYGNARLFKWLARRGANEWCSYRSPEASRATRKDRVQVVTDPSKGGYYNRYTAVNINAHYRTAEVRIFRSTVRPARFYGYLQTLEAAVEFTRAHRVGVDADQHAQAGERFVTWTYARRAQYPDLCERLDGREEYAALEPSVLSHAHPAAVVLALPPCPPDAADFDDAQCMRLFATGEHAAA